MEARQRPLQRTRIPAAAAARRQRTASVGRPVLQEKSVEFSTPADICTTPIISEKQRTRKKWKSFNHHYSSTPINNNNVDLLREWREEMAEEQNIASLIQLSKDLLAFEVQNFGIEEIAYRQEQALYWLCKAAERGSKEARDQVTDMFHQGQGVNEANFEIVYACSWQGGLSVLQLMGRRLGRKTFRQLELGRGFCSTDQIYRLMQGKDVNNLDAEDVKFRCKGSRRVFEQDLAEAGSQHMNGQLPDLDRQLDLYRKSKWILVEFTFCLTAFGLIMGMIQFGHHFALPTVILMMTSLMILYQYIKQQETMNFESWSKIWPKNLLIPGLYESAVTKYLHRRNIHSGLLVTVTTLAMAFFNTGAPFHLVMFSLTLLVLWKDLSLMVLMAYCLTLAVEIDLPQIISSCMTTTLEFELISNVLPSIPPSPKLLMLFDVPPLPDYAFEISLHILTFGILAYQTWSKKCPQLLWPLMYLTAYSTSYNSMSWILLSTVSMLQLAFSSQIYRLKTISLAVLVWLVFSAMVLSEFKDKGPFKDLLNKIVVSQNKNKATLLSEETVGSNDNLILWNEFHDLCMAEEQWEMNLEQQMQCSTIMGHSIHWQGQVAATQLQPWFGLVWLNRLGWFGMQCQMKVHMFSGRGLMQKIKTITATSSAMHLDSTTCFNTQIGNQISFDGYLTNYGETTTKLVIQTITNVP